MILIPPYFNNKTPNSEKKVFNALKEDNNPLTKNWLVYHSLNYPVSITKNKKNSYKYFGESDFLIVAKGIGIINIEVKGGSVNCIDGVWTTKGRNGETKKLKGSPIKQAHDTKYDIQNYISSKFNKKYPQEYLIIFPDCNLSNDNIEFSANNIVCKDELDNIFSQKIQNLIKHLKPGGDIFILENEDILKLKKIIRPDFETHIKTSTILLDSKSEINNYTKDQLKVLDSLGTEPRLLITGSQGTGKTVMAEEILNRFVATGKKILFINSGRLANIITKLKYINDYDNLHFFTFNKFIKDINIYYNKDISNSPLDFIKSNNFLTTNALDALNTSQDKSFLYDLIIIDEMQHCYFYDNFYLLLDKVLNKGLLEGNYYFFGDFDYQNIIGEQIDKQILEERKPKNNLQSYEGIKLWNNVRNAEDIGYEAPIISGLIEDLPLPYAPNQTFGKIEHFFSKNKEEKQNQLLKILKKLKGDNIDGFDIVILSNYKLENIDNILNSVDISQYYNIYDLSLLWNEGFHKNEKNKINDKSTLYFSTTLGFQGLESKIIIYLDPLEVHYNNNNDHGKTSDAAHLLLFNAMGRANTFLYMLWNKEFESWYQTRLRLLGKLTAKNEN
jgi:archaellum biogenesis ATPase FlaH